MNEPKPLSMDELVASATSTAPPSRPRARDVDDITIEEANERARVQHAQRSLRERGELIRKQLGTPEMQQRRDDEAARREREWRRKAPVRARARGVPLDDHDVARIALDAEPPRGQALDLVREFLAWRDAEAARLDRPRCKAMLVLISPAGGGKTSAGGWAVTWHRDSAHYVLASEVSAHPHVAHSESHVQWAKWRSPDLLVIDEIGLERDPMVVLALAQERYGAGRATMLIGNLTTDEFFARYPDPRLGSRMAQQAARGGPTLVELTNGDIRNGGEP